MAEATQPFLLRDDQDSLRIELRAGDHLDDGEERELFLAELLDAVVLACVVLFVDNTDEQVQEEQV